MLDTDRDGERPDAGYGCDIKWRIVKSGLVLSALLFAASLCSLIAGSMSIPLSEVFNVLTGSTRAGESAKAIIWEIRLPRLIMGMASGSALSAGGLVFQAILRNPLAEPYILGISGGAASGAVLAMSFSLPFFPWVSCLALAGSLLALILCMMIYLRTGGRAESILLGGVMINTFCSALIMFFFYISSGGRLHHMLFWLMGDLSMAQTWQLFQLWLLLPCFLLIFILARPMNLILMGDDPASCLGINVKAINLSLLLISSLMVSLVVSLAGLIGFVGLVVPHVLRLILGSDHRILVPASILGGAAFLVLCDLFSRNLVSQGELPVGIVTAFVGAPVFIWLLWRKGR